MMVLDKKDLRILQDESAKAVPPIIYHGMIFPAQ